MWRFLVAAFLLSAAPAQAAVTIDGTCTDTGSGVSPRAGTADVAAGHTGQVMVLAVTVASNDALSAVTAAWDTGATNQSMTALGSANVGTAQVYMFGLRNPTVGTSLTFAASWTGGGQVIIYECVFQGADVTTDATAFPVASRVSATNQAPISVAVPSATGNIAFAGFDSTANFTSTTGVNNHFNNAGSQWATAADYWATTGASTTVSASPGSGTTSVVVAFEIAQTAGAATVSPSLMLMGVGP